MQIEVNAKAGDKAVTMRVKDDKYSNCVSLTVANANELADALTKAARSAMAVPPSTEFKLDTEQQVVAKEKKNAN